MDSFFFPTFSKLILYNINICVQCISVFEILVYSVYPSLQLCGGKHVLRQRRSRRLLHLHSFKPLLAPVVASGSGQSPPPGWRRSIIGKHPDWRPAEEQTYHVPYSSRWGLGGRGHVAVEGRIHERQWRWWKEPEWRRWWRRWWRRRSGKWVSDDLDYCNSGQF